MKCTKCGGDIIGDGYTVPFHCEMLEMPNVEPDSSVVYCGIKIVNKNDCIKLDDVK